MIRLNHLLCCGLTALSLASLPVLAAQDDIAVEVRNHSEPVLCAEKDNVSIMFASPVATKFRIEAAHPAYIGALAMDRWAPDWTDCDLSGDPAFAAPGGPRKVTIYEDVETWVTGYTFPSFWRPNDVPFTVGDRTERGFHVVQIWVRRAERAEEVVVVYPADGYWRIRPLPPAHMRWTAYGSSFLVGPIEDDGRPVVNFKSIRFEPKTMTFTVEFARGGSATLKIDKLDQDLLAMDVALSAPVAGTAPFAGIRSMYVTEFNNDTARIAFKDRGLPGWREDNVMTFKDAKATDFWTGRLSPSRHNTSSPDMVLKGFKAQ